MPVPVPVPGTLMVPVGLLLPPVVAFLLVVGNDRVDTVGPLLGLELVIKPLDVVAGTLEELTGRLEDETVSPGQVKTFEKLCTVSISPGEGNGFAYLVTVMLVVSTKDVIVPVTTVS